MDTNIEKIRRETSVDSLVYRLDTNNIMIVALELLKLDLYKAKYFLVEKLMKASQTSSKPAWIYASLVNIINYKVPEIGSLVITRSVLLFKQNYVRNEPIRIDFLAELVNYKVVTNLIMLQILELLMTNITDDSLALAIRIVGINGAVLPSSVMYPVMDKLRSLVQEGDANEYNKEGIEQLLEIRRRGFEDFTVVLVKGEMCHDIDLEDEFVYEEKVDERVYPDFASELLKELEEGEEGDEKDGEMNERDTVHQTTKTPEPVVDMSQTELISLQKTVYLTIMSSLSSEEAVHKLLKLRYKPNILSNIIIRSCVQEKTYSKYYGIICEILILKSSIYRKEFESLFVSNYDTIHQTELNGIRNLGKLYGYLIATEKLPVSTLKVIRLTELDTNSSNRILIKFLLKEMVEEMGTNDFKEVLVGNIEVLPDMFQINGNYDDLIFAINYFTAIGLGMLTDRMRDELETRQRGRKRERSGSRSSGSGSYSRSGSSYSRSGSSRSGSYSRSRSGSYSRSRSPGGGRSPPAGGNTVSRG